MKLGYPLRVLRLSLATYLLNRVVRIGRVVSHTIKALRGITAGSGFATTEMRVILIRAIDSAIRLFPRVVPTLFVDDLAAEQIAPDDHIIKDLGGFAENVAGFSTKTGMELSKTRSVCTASSYSLGARLCRRWKQHGIHFAKRVKALGAGLGAGVRRNVQALQARLEAFAARTWRFRSLKKLG